LESNNERSSAGAVKKYFPYRVIDFSSSVAQFFTNDTVRYLRDWRFAQVSKKAGRNIQKTAVSVNRHLVCE